MASGDVRAGGAFVEFIAKGDKIVQQTCDQIGSKLASLGKTAAMVGAGAAAMGASITGPMLYGLSVLSKWAEEVKTTMRRTGLTFSELDTLADGFKVDGDTLSAGLAKMDSFVVDVDNNSQKAADAMYELGLSMEELAPLTVAQRAMRFAEALSKITDEGKRVALQHQIFGRGGLALNLSGGEAGVNARSDRAAELGGTALHSQEAYAVAEAYVMAKKEMAMATQGLWATLGQAAAPIMIRFIQWLTTIIVRVRQFAEANKPLLTMLFYVADLAVTIGGVVAALGSGIIAFGVLLPMLKSGLVVLLGIVAAGMAVYAVFLAIEYVILSLGSSWRQVGDSIMGYFGSMSGAWQNFVDLIATTGGGISDAISAGELELAWNIAVLGMRLIWVRTINWLTDAWLSFKYFFIVMWEGIVTGVAHAMVSMIASVVNGLNQLTGLLPESVRSRLGLGDISFDAAGMNREIDRDSGATERRLSGEHANERSRAAGEESGISEEMEITRMIAANEAYFAELERQKLMQGPGGAGGAEGAAHGLSVSGTFNAAAAGRMFGSDQALAAAKNSRDLLAELVRLAGRDGPGMVMG